MWIHVKVCGEVAVLTQFCITVHVLLQLCIPFYFALSWTEAVSCLQLNWHLSYYFLLPLVIMESISVLYGCCIAQLSVLSPHYTEMVSEPLEVPGSSTVVWHLDTTYIYIYPWLEGRAGATQIRFRSQSGTWAAVVLLTVWAQQLRKMFSLSISDWLIKVGLCANQRVLMKIFTEAIDLLLSGNYTEEHMVEDGLCSGPVWPTETGVTSGKSEGMREYRAGWYESFSQHFRDFLWKSQHKLSAVVWKDDLQSCCSWVWIY